MANTKVTGDLIASSTIATGNIADNAVTSDKISGITTAHITEGSNLYYTNARARGAVSVSGNALSYNSSTGVITSNFEESPTFTGNANITGELNVGGADSNNAVITLSADTGNWVFTNVRSSRKLEISDSDGTGTVMTIDTSGNVGIGVTSPTAKLDVFRTINITSDNDTGYVNSALILNSTESNSRGAGVFMHNTNDDQEWYTGVPYAANFDKWMIAHKSTASHTDTTSEQANALLTVLSGGNVGIGTTSPSELLHLNKATGDPRIKLETGGGGDPGIIFQSANNRTGEMYFQDGSTSARFSYNHSNESFNLYAHNQTSIDFHLSETTAYFPTQNIGIGTTSPDSKLHVESTSATGANFILETTHSGGIPILDLKGAASAQIRYKDESNVIQGRVDFGDSGTFNFIDVPNNKSTLYLKTGGNVGIGTTSPDASLDIEPSSGDADILLTAGSQTLRLDQNSIRTTTNSNLTLFTNGNSGQLVLKQSNGNVGIGTTNPSYKLDIAGTSPRIRVQENSSNTAVTQVEVENSDGRGAMLGIGGSARTDILTNRGYINAQAATDGLAIGTESTDPIIFYTQGLAASNEKMRITSDGMIGVGMTPSTTGGSTYMLQMYNPGSQCFLALGNGTSGNGPLNGLVIGNDASNAYIYNRESTTLQFGTNDSTKMAILSDGNVGIGTTSSAERVTIAGVGSLYPNIKFTFPGVTSRFMKIGMESAVKYEFHVNGSGTYMSFATEGTEKMRITSSAEAHVELSGTAPVIKATASNGGSGLRINVAAQSGGQLFRVQEDGTTKFQINENGNIGINTTSPDGRLDVRGAISSGMALEDENVSLTSNGGTPQATGILEISQGWSCSSSSGDTIVFTHNSTSWKAWILHYSFASTNGITVGVIGGYWNNSGGSSNNFIENNLGASVAVTHSGQSNIVTFTFTNLGTHPLSSFKYIQHGGDGKPLASKTSITLNS